MPNYTRTGPFNNGGSPGISAGFLNNMENVFNQPSGGTETGKYVVIGNGSNGGDLTCYIVSLSRGSTPVSVTIDHADLLNTVTAPTTQRLSSNGFEVDCNTTATTLSAGAGGSWTIQY